MQTPKKGTSGRLSLRLSLASALIGAVLLTSALLGTVTFTVWRQSIRDDLQKRLGELAATVSLMIDPAVHHGLTQPSDMDGQAYKNLRAKLKAVRAQSPDVHFLYTYRWTPGEESPKFVLDTGTVGVDFSPLGTVYESMTPTLRASFFPPYRVRVETEPYKDEYCTFLSAFSPILGADGQIEGVLGIDMDASRIQALEAQLLALVLGMTALITVVMGLGSWWFSRRISKPLLALSHDMGLIQEFQLDGELNIKTQINEVVLMKTSLDNMKKGLRSFKKYVPADLVADLIGLQQEARLGTTKREITVFFCDLENFTTISEQLSPEDLNLMLSGYFDAVTRALQRHGATIDKFIGDAVMAFWNAPRDLPDHALRGALATLEVRQSLELLREGWKSVGLPGMSTRVGLNTGSVMVGNVGYEDRLSYTALGDAVNLASRLESLNKFYGTYILVGEDTLSQLGNQVAYRAIDRVAVKGKSKGTRIGELAHRVHPSWAAYEKGLNAYFASDFEGALKLFGDPLLAKDGPTAIMVNRCKRFAERGAPEGWDGTWVMADK